MPTGWLRRFRRQGRQKSHRTPPPQSGSPPPAIRSRRCRSRPAQGAQARSIPSVMVRGRRAEHIDKRLADHQDSHDPEGELDQEIARITAVLKGFKVSQAESNSGPPRNEDKQRPGQKPGGRADLVEKPPRSLRITPRQ